MNVKEIVLMFLSVVSLSGIAILNVVLPFDWQSFNLLPLLFSFIAAVILSVSVLIILKNPLKYLFALAVGCALVLILLWHGENVVRNAFDLFGASPEISLVDWNRVIPAVVLIVIVSTISAILVFSHLKKSGHFKRNQKKYWIVSIIVVLFSFLLAFLFIFQMIAGLYFIATLPLEQIFKLYGVGPP